MNKSGQSFEEPQEKNYTSGTTIFSRDPACGRRNESGFGLTSETGERKGSVVPEEGVKI